MKTMMIALFTLVSLSTISAHAERMAPKKVEPVAKDGIRYEAPNKPSRNVIVEAWDESSGKKLWEQVVYESKPDPKMLIEEDALWDPITRLTLDGDNLLIKTQHRQETQQYRMDVKTRKVERIDKDKPTDPAGPVQTNSQAYGVAAQPTTKELLAAPSEISIADQTLVIETHLWRNFMPISPPDGKALIASIKVRTPDKTNLLKGIEIDNVWVLNGEAVWSTLLKTPKKSAGNSPTLELVVRDGPDWKPGVNVTVVVQVKDEKGLLYLLKAPAQNIERTD